MKKLILSFLLLLAASVAINASDAKKDINYSRKVMNSNILGNHQVAIGKLKAAEFIPDITAEEKSAIKSQIALHEKRIAEIQEADRKIEEAAQKALTEKNKPKKDAPQKKTTPKPGVNKPKVKPDVNREPARDSVRREFDVNMPEPLAEPVAPARSGEFKIKNITFSNELRGEVISEEPSPLYASDMRYLYAQIYYDGPAEETEKRVYVKIYDPQGKLKIANEGDEFTFTQRMWFYPYDGMEDYLAGTGNARKSIFTPGIHTYEIWIDSKLVARKQIDIKLKPGENTIGSAEIQSLNATPKNYSIGFDLTIAAVKMPGTQLTTRISFYDAATGKPVMTPSGEQAFVERTENIIYDEAVLSFSMNMPYSKFNLPKGWSGTISYTAQIIDRQGNIIASYPAGSFNHTQN